MGEEKQYKINRIRKKDGKVFDGIAYYPKERDAKDWVRYYKKEYGHLYDYEIEETALYDKEDYKEE
jgi:hypothetical protein